MLREIEFGRKSPSGSECNSGGSKKVAVAALTPNMLKHAKVVDMNHLHVSHAHTHTHAHASVLKATVEQHDVRLTG